MRISRQLRSERREANGINREQGRNEKAVAEEKSKQDEKAEGAENAVSPSVVTVSQPTNLGAFCCRQSQGP